MGRRRYWPCLSSDYMENERDLLSMDLLTHQSLPFDIWKMNRIHSGYDAQFI